MFEEYFVDLDAFCAWGFCVAMLLLQASSTVIVFGPAFFQKDIYDPAKKGIVCCVRAERRRIKSFCPSFFKKRAGIGAEPHTAKHPIEYCVSTKQHRQ